MDYLYCRPDKVGTGVGTALCVALEVRAISAGITDLFVEASEGARRFFDRRGFWLNGWNDFIVNGVALHNYRMSKWLAR